MTVPAHSCNGPLLCHGLQIATRKRSQVSLSEGKAVVLHHHKTCTMAVSRHLSVLCTGLRVAEEHLLFAAPLDINEKEAVARGEKAEKVLCNCRNPCCHDHQQHRGRIQHVLLPASWTLLGEFHLLNSHFPEAWNRQTPRECSFGGSATTDPKVEVAILLVKYLASPVALPARSDVHGCCDNHDTSRLYSSRPH